MQCKQPGMPKVCVAIAYLQGPLKALLGGGQTGRGIAEKTGREGGKPQADLSFGEEFQRREWRRLKIRRNQGSRRGDRFGSPIKNEGKGLPVPVRRWGVELLWLKQSQPADLGGRTKVGKTHGCCREKMPLSQCLSLPFWLLSLPLLWGILISRFASKWATALLDGAPKGLQSPASSEGCVLSKSAWLGAS